MSAEVISAMLGGEWKSHPKHSAYYFSSAGHAARLTTKKGGPYVTLLKGCACGIGYRAISYPLGNGCYGRIYIHRAVCELFNGPPPAPGLHVRHLDCNMTNNRASNLAWGTPLDNARDGVRNGKIKRGEDNPMAVLTRKQVEQMREIRRTTGAFYKDIAAKFGVSRMTAHRAITGALWK